MTTPEIIALVTKYQETSLQLIADHGCTQVQWIIEDVDPSQFEELGQHFKTGWFVCGKKMAINILVHPTSLVTIFSPEVQIKQTFEYIKQ